MLNEAATASSCEEALFIALGVDSPGRGEGIGGRAGKAPGLGIGKTGSVGVDKVGKPFLTVCRSVFLLSPCPGVRLASTIGVPGVVSLSVVFRLLPTKVDLIGENWSGIAGTGMSPAKLDFPGRVVVDLLNLDLPAEAPLDLALSTGIRKVDLENGFFADAGVEAMGPVDIGTGIRVGGGRGGSRKLLEAGPNVSICRARASAGISG